MTSQQDRAAAEINYRLKFKIKQRVGYSVVITEANDFINKETLRAAIAKTANGKYVKGRDGGVFTDYLDYDNDYEELFKTPVYKYMTPRTVYQPMSDDEKKAIDALKKYINKHPCVLSWHDGDEDTKCEFNGKHLHIAVFPVTNEGQIGKNTMFKNAKTNIHFMGGTIRTQTLKQPQNFLQYMLKKPKEFMGANNETLLTTMDSIKNLGLNPTKDTPNEKKKKLKSPKSKVFEDRKSVISDMTETLVEFMVRFNTIDRHKLFDKLIKQEDQTEANTMLQILRNPQSGSMIRTAQQEVVLRRKTDTRTYLDKFIEEEPEDSPEFLTTYETHILLQNWCREQNIDSQTFLGALFLVLGCKLPKKNTLYMQGASNAGKPFWTSAIIPDTDRVGMHIVSKEFAFQECVDKDIIQISELTITTQEQAEIYKQVFAGEQLYVNVKGKKGELLTRKPVVLTTNTPIWKYITNEKNALQNRMFAFQNLRQSQVLGHKPIDKRANPEYFRMVFRLINYAAQMNRIELTEQIMWRQDFEFVYTAEKCATPVLADITTVDETISIISEDEPMDEQFSENGDNDIKQINVNIKITPVEVEEPMDVVDENKPDSPLPDYTVVFEPIKHASTQTMSPPKTPETRTVGSQTNSAELFNHDSPETPPCVRAALEEEFNKLSNDKHSSPLPAVPSTPRAPPNRRLKAAADKLTPLKLF